VRAGFGRRQDLGPREDSLADHQKGWIDPHFANGRWWPTIRGGRITRITARAGGGDLHCRESLLRDPKASMIATGFGARSPGRCGPTLGGQPMKRQFWHATWQHVDLRRCFLMGLAARHGDAQRIGLGVDPVLERLKVSKHGRRADDSLLLKRIGR